MSTLVEVMQPIRQALYPRSFEYCCAAPLALEGTADSYSKMGHPFHRPKVAASPVRRFTLPIAGKRAGGPLGKAICRVMVGHSFCSNATPTPRQTTSSSMYFSGNIAPTHEFKRGDEAIMKIRGHPAYAVAQGIVATFRVPSKPLAFDKRLPTL